MPHGKESESDSFVEITDRVTHKVHPMRLDMWNASITPHLLFYLGVLSSITRIRTLQEMNDPIGRAPIAIIFVP